jgi:uncharacterized protein YukE
MPKLTQTTDLTPEPTVVIEPKLRQALQTKLTAYAALQAQIKALNARKDALTAELGELRDQAEQLSVSVEGYGSVTYVSSLQKKFNPKKFVQLGGNLAVYNEAVENVPKKPYEKITVVGVSRWWRR